MKNEKNKNLSEQIRENLNSYFLYLVWLNWECSSFDYSNISQHERDEKARELLEEKL